MKSPKRPPCTEGMLHNTSKVQNKIQNIIMGKCTIWSCLHGVWLHRYLYSNVTLQIYILIDRVNQYTWKLHFSIDFAVKMREIVFILILVFTGYGCSLVSAVTDSEWLDWKLKHDKDYDSQEEELSRRQIWINNYKLIEEHNKGDHTFKLALNHLADLVRIISYYHLNTEVFLF